MLPHPLLPTPPLPHSPTSFFSGDNKFTLPSRPPQDRGKLEDAALFVERGMRGGERCSKWDFSDNLSILSAFKER
ncbi:hypothetical protein CYANOKiyG1_42480 [Okeania sp. KiyG1]|nr:hypothetical protein CYANOKiyG1_42480 [Okeania sp. KiyG1]